MSDATAVRDAALRAREAAITLAVTPRAAKDAGLQAMADSLDKNASTILAANESDVSRARDAGTSDAMVDRLTLSEDRLRGMADGLRDVARLPDPVGEVVRGSTLPNGLELRQVRVPLGVVGIIYEARPNVTADAAGLCLKSGNAVLLRGSSSAAESNAALVDAMRSALAEVDLPADAVQLISSESRVGEAPHARTRAGRRTDPEGGASLIRSIVEESTVPVIETGVGNCHVYVDAAADLDVALAILIDAKVSRPSVCNAAETVLVHSAVADEFVPRALTALREHGVTVHGDERVRSYDGDGVVPATDEDWDTEYLSLDIAAAVVPSLDAAVDHIRRHGSAHTDAIVTSSQQAARQFVASVDSSSVVVNASTRFTDGSEFGFGAEIGISNQKLHARGPMGLPELTSTKYIVTGDGHTRG